ncbi:hypothetical protein H0X48_04800, partial [Candidatus Dependentiae bacterium]|nr:hypothetical protein [Candidatus Dependentiae bacterium]
MNRKTKVIIITGTSSAGKTTLVHHLKLKLPKDLFEVYDFDEKGVPINSDQQWRQKTTDYWLIKAFQNSQINKSTIICGVVVPAEVICSTVKPALPLCFGFIKVSDVIIKSRLQARGWGDQLVQDNINWANYLEAEVKKQNCYRIVASCSYSGPEEVAQEFIHF